MDKTKNIFLVVFVFVISGLLFATDIPRLTKPVMDTAEILGEETESFLDEQILALERDTKSQVAVLTVPTLEDESIESFSGRVFKEWKLGQKDLDNGVLLTVAVNDHKLRIEPGYGLEGSLTDTKCGIIIRNFITPYFKQNDYESGIKNGVNAIVGIIIEDEELNAKIADLEMKEKEHPGSTANILIPLAMFGTFFGLVAFSVAYSKKHGGTSSSSSSSSSHSSSYSHSSHSYSSHSHSSGGGYSGGGGHSGGGGASGGW